MTGQVTKSKEQMMSEEAFNALLEWLHSDREQAGKIYEDVRNRLIRFAQNRDCPFFEECADETIHRVAQIIYGGKKISIEKSLYSYFYAVAANVLKEFERDK